MGYRAAAAALIASCPLLVAVAPGASGVAGASASPAPPGATRLAAEVQPSVTLLRTKFTADVTVTKYRDNHPALNHLTSVLQAEQNDNRLAPGLQSINRQWLNVIASHPDTYMYPGSSRVVQATVYAQCSGWIATPGGYLVTAAHCVDTSSSEVAADLRGAVVPPFINRDYRQSVRNFQRHGVPMDEGMLRQLKRIQAEWFDAHAQLTSVSAAVTVELPVKGRSLQQPAVRDVPAHVVLAGKEFPGKDYAVLKVDGYRNLPSLGLGSTAGLQVGDQLYVDGYPGTVTSDPAFTAGSLRVPTFTEGPLSAFRTTKPDTLYLQTQAPAYQGNSGGPVFGPGSQVIGILIAGSVDPSTHQIVAGEEFVLSAGVIRAALSTLGVHAQAGPVMTAYAQALGDYSRAYYSAAVPGFQQVLSRFPEHPYASWYLKLARAQIAAGHDRTPAGLSSSPAAGLLAGLGVAVLVAILAAAAALVLRARRTRTAVAGVPASAGFPVETTPAAPPPGIGAGPPAGGEAGPAPGPALGSPPSSGLGRPTATDAGAGQGHGPVNPPEPPAPPLPWNG